MADQRKRQCPECGRFCGDIEPDVKGMSLEAVYGRCSQHGTVMLRGWSWDDFEHEDDNG